MSANFLWTTYGVGEDSALKATGTSQPCRPSMGQTTSPLNADSFVIMDTTKNHETAVNALKYMQIDRGGAVGYLRRHARRYVPARTHSLPRRTRPSRTDVDWQVAKDSLAYADSPNFEAFMPKYNESLA